jgi:D-alanyl-D-alanine dipeptidase
MSRVVLSCVLFGALASAAAATSVLSTATTLADADLVDVSTLVPDIALDMRYAGSDNFVGQRIDGYEAARCLLKSDVARALADVERKLRKKDLRLRLFDCYRPARAVRQFVEWAATADTEDTRARYYPRLRKSDLLGAYIAPVSGHSRGATVDLTLLQCADDGVRCSALDMGTPFDFFDVRANTDSMEITSAQRANRQRLRDAMQQGGFHNYSMEWWHFSYQPEPSPDTIYDVPIQ